MLEALGIGIPIVQAPIGGAAGPELAAAVSNAGGLGIITLTDSEGDEALQRIRAAKRATSRPFAANFILALTGRYEAALDLALAEGVPVISLFWGDPAPLVGRIHAAGAQVMFQAGSVEEARRAADAGVDMIVAQGWEAGGHVRGTVSTLALVPAVVDAVAPAPVLAGGGIADGRGLAAALVLGARGAVIGTRFLLSHEAATHPIYRERVLSARADDTVYATLFDVGWPDAPHRVIRNSTVDAWEAAGRPASGRRPGEGDIVATDSSGSAVRRYEAWTPYAGLDGSIEAMPLWAGQGVGLCAKRQAAGEIVREIWEEAGAALSKTQRWTSRAG